MEFSREYNTNAQAGHCYDSVNHFGLVSGQTFYTGGWNIIIRDDEGC